MAAGEEVIYIETDQGLMVLSTANGNTEWTREGGTEFSSVFAHGDTVLLSEGEGSVRALDAQTGRERWVAEVPSEADSPPFLTVAVDAVLAAGGTQLTALDMESGESRWAVDPSSERGTGGVWRSVTVQGDLVVAGYSALPDNGTSGVRAFDIMTGEERWHALPEVWGAAALAGMDQVFVVDELNPSRIFALDMQSGEENWHLESAWRDWILTESHLLVLTDETSKPAALSVTAIDPSSGEAVWELSEIPNHAEETGDSLAGLVGGMDGLIMVRADDGSLTGVGLPNGERLWSRNFGIYPSIAGGTDFVAIGAGLSDGLVHLVDPSTGEDLRTIPTTGASLTGPSLVLGPSYLLLLDEQGDGRRPLSLYS